MLLALRSPRIGLNLAVDAVSAVLVSRSWGAQPSLQSASRAPLAPGLMQPLSHTPNLTDVAALSRAIRQVTTSIGLGPRRHLVALTLPDPCGRVALFEFDQWPTARTEQEAVLRSRFHKDLTVGPTPARLAYQIFARQGEYTEDRTRTGGVRVLAMVVSEAIMAQYEEACLDAGLIPVRVGVLGLALCAFFQPTMHKTGAPAYCFVHATADQLMVIGFLHGVPVFLRCKALTGLDPTLLVHEVAATVAFYQERFSYPSGASTRSIRLPCFETGIMDGVSALDGILEDHHLAIVPLRWETHQRSGTVQVPGHAMAALAALSRG